MATNKNVLMNGPGAASKVAARQIAETTDPNPTGEVVKWPAWFYGPDGQSQIFQSADEVPSGWEDHWDKVAKSASVVAAENDKAKLDAEFEGQSDGDIMKALDEAKVEYKSDWPRDKLIAVLRANKDAK